MMMVTALEQSHDGTRRDCAGANTNSSRSHGGLGLEARSRRGARRLWNGTGAKGGPIAHGGLALWYGIWPAGANRITITQSIAEGGGVAKYTPGGGCNSGLRWSRWNQPACGRADS
jgi:hypothetical protein